MIDRGVNPFVVSYCGTTQFDNHNLECLPNLPNQRSIYFTTRPFLDGLEAKNEFPDSWFYKTGVFDGRFDSLIGQGASGIFIRGEWFGKRAAFKFTEIRNQEQQYAKDSLKALNEKLSEIISLQSTAGSKIVSFYGHYR